MSGDTTDEMLTLVGAIYDCVIDPARWPQTLRLIADRLACKAAARTVVDKTGPSLFTVYNTGLAPEWSAQHTMQNFGAEAIDFFTAALSQPGIDQDTPLVISRVLSPEAQEKLRVFRDWAKPQGLVDCMSIVVLDAPDRFGTVDMVRHESVGIASEEAIATMRRLAPHLRRAVTISHLLDMRTLQLDAVSATLDVISHGVAVVGEGGRLLHANAAAKGMMTEGLAIVSDGGRLATPEAECTERLQAAIEGTRGAAGGQPGGGIAIRLPGTGDRTALAYVLPLTLGRVTTRLSQDALAVVLVTGATAASSHVAEAMTTLYGLTLSEARLLAQIISGVPVSEAAVTLGIEVSTARTHLSRVFSKTGTTRQPELIALATRLVAPLTM